MMAKGMFQTERPHMEGIEEGSAGGPVCLGYFNWEGGVGGGGVTAGRQPLCGALCTRKRNVAFLFWVLGSREDL